MSCRWCGGQGVSLRSSVVVTRGSGAYIRQVLACAQAAASAVLGPARSVVVDALDGDVVLAEHALEGGDEGRADEVA